MPSSTRRRRSARCGLGRALWDNPDVAVALAILGAVGISFAWNRTGAVVRHGADGGSTHRLRPRLRRRPTTVLFADGAAGPPGPAGPPRGVLEQLDGVYAAERGWPALLATWRAASKVDDFVDRQRWWTRPFTQRFVYWARGEDRATTERVAAEVFVAVADKSRADHERIEAAEAALAAAET